MNRQAVVFVTHRFDPEIERRFVALRDQCRSTSGPARPRDVFISAEHDAPIPPRYDHLTHRFRFESLRSLARDVIGDRIVPGNAHLRALDFQHHHPDHSEYWFIEYDVVYRGHWGRFLAELDHDRADLLACRVRPVRDHPEWPWQAGFGTGDDVVAEADQIFAFLPIHRISHRGLEAVRGAVRRGWVGHFEVLVPTALAHEGWTIADIGGRGAWTPAERRGRYYLDHGLPDTYQCLGTMRFRPSIKVMPARGMLYHPCKPADDGSAHWPMRFRRELFGRALRSHPRETLGYVSRLVAVSLRSWLPLRRVSTSARG